MQPVILSCLLCHRRRFPSKHLGQIVHGLCFLWVNDSSIRCRRDTKEWLKLMKTIEGVPSRPPRDLIINSDSFNMIEKTKYVQGRSLSK